jgi:hypothetical protein
MQLPPWWRSIYVRDRIGEGRHHVTSHFVRKLRTLRFPPKDIIKGREKRRCVTRLLFIIIIDNYLVGFTSFISYKSNKVWWIENDTFSIRGNSIITLLIAHFQLIFSYFELDFCANKDSNEKPESSIPTDTSFFMLHLYSLNVIEVCTSVSVGAQHRMFPIEIFSHAPNPTRRNHTRAQNSCLFLTSKQRVYYPFLLRLFAALVCKTQCAKK